MLYWVFKWVVFVPIVRVLFRPTIEGQEHIPATGPAIVVSNHLSAGDTFTLPSMIKRQVIFPAKSELFVSRGLKSRIVAWFLRNVGQLPMDRSGGRASASSMDEVLGVLRQGRLLGIYPEGTRSPDGRLYKGKTGVARLVLSAGVPVVPVGMVNSRFERSKPFGLPLMKDPHIRIGPPMDFRRYASAGNDREVLRWVTDEIMNAVMELSAQTYVDAYGGSVKSALDAGQDFPVTVMTRPGEGRPVPPVPEAEVEAARRAGRLVGRRAGHCAPAETAVASPDPTGLTT